MYCEIEQLFIDCEISFSFPEMVSSNACTVLWYAIVVAEMWVQCSRRVGQHWQHRRSIRTFGIQCFLLHPTKL